MSSQTSVKKTKAKPFAIMIRLDSMFALYFSAILAVVFGYSLWCCWRFIDNAIISGKLWQQITKFGEYNLQAQFSVLLTPLGFFVPLCIAGGTFYFIIILLRGYFRPSYYYMVFSKNGINTAGFCYDWKSMIWFGAKKCIVKQGVVPCWATRAASGNRVILHLPSITPISEELFTLICEEVSKRFSSKIEHLHSLSWKPLWFDNDFPFEHRVETIIPYENKPKLQCEILKDMNGCLKEHRPEE